MVNLLRETLKRYLEQRGASLPRQTLKHYRRCIVSLLDFLRRHHPEVDSFARLERGHIEGWLRFLGDSYTKNTHRSFIEHVHRFLMDIRRWDWPDSPSCELLHSGDYPPRQFFLSTQRDFTTRTGTLYEALLPNCWNKILKRYLGIRGEELHPSTLSAYRSSILPFLGFLSASFPEVDSLGGLQRSPHIQGWLEKLSKAKPPYTDSTRCAHLRHLRRFLGDIRQWGWPDCPPPGLILREDVPGLRLRGRRGRIRELLDPAGNIPRLETSCHRSLNRYLDIRGTTLRPDTVGQYRSSILSLLDFLRVRFPEVDSFAKLQRDPHIEGWLLLLAQAKPPYSNESRREKIRHLSRFLEEVREWAWPDSPPPGLIRRGDFPPSKNHLPKPLPPEVDAALRAGLCKDGHLISLGLLIARRTGLRIGELLRLDLNCLIEDPSGLASLRVPLGKMRNERVVPIEGETADLLKRIRGMRGQRLASIDPETGRPVEYLFADAKGHHIRRHHFLRKLKTVAKAAGITENVYPHRLRHTYATELLRFGVTLPGIMKLLGHRTIKMTLRYVAVTDEDLRRDYLKAMERARLHYDNLKGTEITAETGKEYLVESLRSAFDHLVAHFQSARFDHPDPVRRKRLQRVVERLRRWQTELPDLQP